MTDKPKTGRPTDYSAEVVDTICRKMAEGLSLRSICREESMPCIATVFNWLRAYPEFLEQYEKAMEVRAIYHAEELMDISDDGTNDWMEKRDKDGNVIGWQVNGEAIQRSRLRVDTRKWIASKLLPKKYGDKVGIEHSGKVEGLAINIDLGSDK